MQYFVAGNIQRDGREYKRGDKIDVPEPAATQLLEVGVIQTEPLSDTQDVTPPVAEKPAQPEVSGAPVQTGEPSIDGSSDTERKNDNAQDVTPPVADGMRALSPDVRADAPNAPQQGSETPVEPTEDMTRAELDALAIAEGIDEQKAKSASNKGAVIELIRENRAKSVQPNAQTDGQPAHDPSVGL